MPRNVVFGDVDLGIIRCNIGKSLLYDGHGVLPGSPIVNVVWNRHESCDNRMSEFGKEGQERNSRYYVHGKCRVVLQKILIPTQGKAYKHPVGDSSKDSHAAVPGGHICPSGSIDTKGLVDTCFDLVKDRRNDGVNLACQVAVNDMLVEDSLDKVWIGKGVIPLERVVVCCSNRRDIVRLIGEPPQLFVRDDNLMATRYIGDYV